jgi:tetratricopeptide (TPR) repeat protein
MKTPKSITKVSVAEGMIPAGPYPPLGFVPLWEAELGNGDYYGLFWPLGKEESDPVVCDMSHDDWSLLLAFSSLDKFIEWLDANDWERGEKEIKDYDFAPRYFIEGKSCLSKNDIDGAIGHFQKACKSFSEMSDYWFSLSSQLRRVKRLDEAIIACINAFNSNWVFGMPAEGVLRMLKSAIKMEAFKDEPLIRIVTDVTMKFGGTKENHQYNLFTECAEEYFKNGKPIEGLKLMQNYAFMMSMETSAFQERYEFNLADWQKQYLDLCQKHLGTDRKWNG